MHTTMPDRDLELAKLPVAKMQDVLLARFVAREEAAKLGYPPADLIRIATAVSEITRNVVQHAGAAGAISFHRVQQDGRTGLRIVVTDGGCGIPDVNRALTGAGVPAGAGIPGARKLMNEVEIDSVSGHGTKVTMLKWL